MLTSRLSRILLLAGMSTVALGSSMMLSGCFATTQPLASAVPADEAPRKKSDERKPRLLPMPTLDAFRGHGIYSFDDEVRTQLFIKDAIAVNGRYAVQENFPLGTRHGFTWGSGAVALLRNGRVIDVERPSFLTLNKTRDVLFQFKGGGQKPVELKVVIVAYDLENQPIGPYLVTRQKTPTPTGYVIGSKYVFPKGAVGYRTILEIDRDEVLVPTRTAFTGSARIEDFTKRFTRQIPYCLRYIPTRKAEPLGLRFDKPIVKKTKTVRGRAEEVAQSGSVQLFPVKKNTLFCAAEGSSVLGTAKWDLRYVNGTRLLEFTFPKSIASSNFGVLREHRHALKLAFAEEVAEERGRTVRKVRPVMVWKAGEEIVDAQWRFNDIAADAVSDALARTKDARKAWHDAHDMKRK